MRDPINLSMVPDDLKLPLTSVVFVHDKQTFRYQTKEAVEYLSLLQRIIFKQHEGFLNDHEFALDNALRTMFLDQLMPVVILCGHSRGACFLTNAELDQNEFLLASMKHQIEIVSNLYARKATKKRNLLAKMLGEGDGAEPTLYECFNVYHENGQLYRY